MDRDPTTTTCSVVIPTHNRTDFLPDCLASVLQQTLKPAKIVVVDDGSTDDTPALLASFGDQIETHRITNQGKQVARNLGVKQCDSDWIAFIDDDDMWEPDHLESLMALARAEPELTLVFSDFRTLRDGTLQPGTKFQDAPPGWWNPLIERRLDAGWLLSPGIAEASFQFYPPFPSALAIRRRLFWDLGGFDAALHGRRGEDGPFFTRALALGRSGAVPKPTAIIRKHDRNATVDIGSRNKMLSLIDEMANMRYLRDRYPALSHLHPAIERELVVRGIRAAHAAFAAGEHATVRRVVDELPPEAVGTRLKLKATIARLPDPIAKPLNRLTQMASTLTSWFTG